MSQMYDVSQLGTANNFIAFNDYTAAPIFRVKHTRPMRREIREQDAPIPNSPGVADFESEEGKSYFVIEGTMYAKDEAEYYTGRRRLRKVGNLDIQQKDPLSDDGYVLYRWTEAGQPRGQWVKVQYVDRMDESSGKGYAQDFSLMCKMKYPYIIDPNAVTTTIGLSGQGVVTGTSGYPIGYPFAYGATTYNVGGSVVNLGDADAYPSMNIFGPVNTPRLTNTTTGEYIEVNVNLASSDDTLSIGYDQDTAPTVLLNGVSVYDKVTTGSKFFRIKPGANELNLSGASINNAYATISFYSTWPMS